MDLRDVVKKLNPAHDTHQLTYVAQTDLFHRFFCSCGQTLTLSMLQAFRLSSVEYVKHENERFDITDLTMLRDYAVKELNATPQHSYLSGMMRPITQPEEIALAYYKASITLLKSRGFIAGDVPVPVLYQPESEVTE